MPPSKRFIRSTAAQIRFMIDFMMKNLDILRRSKQSLSPYENEKIEEKWNQLKEALKEYGPERNVSNWKHTWRDLVKHARVEKRKYDQLIAEGEYAVLSTQAEAVFEVLSAAHGNSDGFDNIGEDRNDTNSEFEVLMDALEESDDEAWNKKKQWSKSKNNGGTAQSTKRSSINGTNTVNKRLRVDPLIYQNLGDIGNHETETENGYTFLENRVNVKKEPRHRRHSSSPNNSNTQNKDINCSTSENSDVNLLNTLNKFIEFEKEKEKLAHEREMSRIAQNETMLNLCGRMVNVIEDLAPSIKNFLNSRDQNMPED